MSVWCLMRDLQASRHVPQAQLFEASTVNDRQSLCQAGFTRFRMNAVSDPTWMKAAIKGRAVMTQTRFSIFKMRSRLAVWRETAHALHRGQ